MNLLIYNFFRFHFLTFSQYHILLFLLFVSCTRSVSVDEALSKSVRWMWEQQSEDGGWHSQTHAVLRDGRVLTPYILYHLLQVPDEIFQIEQHNVDKALAFISKEMMLALDSNKMSLSDYPNYSAAYALRVLHKLNRDTITQRIIAEYLLEQQFVELGFVEFDSSGSEMLHHSSESIGRQSANP